MSFQIRPTFIPRAMATLGASSTRFLAASYGKEIYDRSPKMSLPAVGVQVALGVLTVGVIEGLKKYHEKLDRELEAEVNAK